jgi:Flp pilus assembly protein TadG
MRLRPKKTIRRGASLAEAALVIPVFLALVVGMIDLGIGVLHWCVLSEAARHGARQAIVHGALAPPSLGNWGPATYGPVAATDSNPIASAVRTALAGMDPSTVTVKVEWLDGDNQPDHSVRVTLGHTYKPLTGLIFSSSFSLGAGSTMRIAH